MNHNQKVIIIGSSGHSKVIIDIFEKDGNFDIIGLVDAAFGAIPVSNLGYDVLGNEEFLSELLRQNSDSKLFIAIGDNHTRKKVYKKIVKQFPKIEFASAIHPSAQIGKNVFIGKGCAVMAGAIINSCTEIKDFVIINTKASIDHDSEMQEFSSLAPGVTTGANISIGELSAVSIGATIKHGISVGNNCVIGAGALLIKNCPDNKVMYGIPAIEIRDRIVGEKYL